MNAVERQVERLAVSTADACSMTGLGRTVIFKLLKDGEIRRIRVGGRTLVDVSSIREFLARKAVANG